MITRGIAVRVLLALVLAAPLAAQQPAMPDSTTHGPMGFAMHCPMMGGMMGNGMMGDMRSSDSMKPGDRAMAFGPASLLSREAILGLSEKQKSRLTALRDGAKVARDAADAEAKEHAKALGQVLKAPAPDTGAARRHFQAAHTARGNAQWVMLRAAAQAKAVLTEAQRARVEGWIDERERAKAGSPDGMGMMGMMGMMGGMEMDKTKCPMVHDGMHGGPSQP